MSRAWQKADIHALRGLVYQPTKGPVPGVNRQNTALKRLAAFTQVHA